MERKADLPPATSLSGRPITAAAGGDPNLTSFSTSSTSSSSLSPSDPLRQLHAALKRHKPLGTMQSDLPRARRILVSRPEPTKSTLLKPSTKSTLSKPSISSRSQTNLVSHFRETKPPQNVNAGTVPASTSQAEPSLTPPPLTETLNNDNARDKEIGFQNHEKKSGDEMLVDLKQPYIDFNASLNPNENALVNKNNNNNGDHYARPNAEIKMENKMSSCLHSLALSEEMDTNQKHQNLNTKFGGSNIPQKPINVDPITQLNPTNPDPMTQTNPINLNPITQCSAVNSSCITKQSTVGTRLANYENAPVEKKVSIQSEAPSKDKNEKKDKEKEKEKSKKKYDPDVFFKVNGKYYQKLGQIGSGGSSEVHKVASADKTIYAMKKIKLKGRDYQTALGFCQEIKYLNKLKGKSHIIQLIDYEITDKSLLLESSNTKKEGRIKEDHYIYMVLEYGEIDLAHMVYQKWEETNNSNPIQIDENWLRFYWQQMLEAVNTIHEQRIVHSDLKPANFLLVQGSLKLIDFGIAKAIMNDTTNIQRDAQVGTLNYMSPEAFLCNEEDSEGAPIKCGRPSDIWSLGCILYQMVYGKTPFAHYTSFWTKLRVVTDRNHEISYRPVRNPWLIDLMKRCLAWDRNDRWRISELLKHPFLVPPVLPMESPVGEGMERVGVPWNHPEVSRLCSEITEVIRRIEKEKGKCVDMEESS